MTADPTARAERVSGDAGAAEGSRRSQKEGQHKLQKIALQGAADSKESLKDAGEQNGRVQFVKAQLGSAIEAVTVLVDQTLWFSLRTAEHVSPEDSDTLRMAGDQLRALKTSFERDALLRRSAIPHIPSNLSRWPI